MEKHDSKYESIEKTLSAIGKATFVQFYYEFKDTTIFTEELAQKILLNKPRAKSSNQNFRIPRARHIFEKGKELEALQIIMESTNVDLASKRLAKEIPRSKRRRPVDISFSFHKIILYIIIVVYIYWLN